MKWHHRPVHVFKPGTMYMVTAGTVRKQHFFRGDEKLGLLEKELKAATEAYKWQVQAWALFSNHYHFIAFAPQIGRAHV